MKGEQFVVKSFNLGGDGQKTFSFSRRVKGTFGFTARAALKGGGKFSIVKDLDGNGFDAGDKVFKTRTIGAGQDKIVHQAPLLKGDYLIVFEGNKGAKGSIAYKVRKMYSRADVVNNGDDLLGGGAGVNNDNSVTNIQINQYTTNYYPTTTDVVNPTTTPSPTPTTSSSWNATITGPADDVLTGGNGNPIGGSVDVLHTQCLALVGVQV